MTFTLLIFRRGQYNGPERGAIIAKSFSDALEHLSKRTWEPDVFRVELVAEETY